jgi:hypothetical protein
MVSKTKLKPSQVVIHVSIDMISLNQGIVGEMEHPIVIVGLSILF